MIKISHETPLSLLEESREFNDYDYCLVHMLDIEPGYRKFYEDSSKMGRHVLLDNSIFELGKAFEPKEFVKEINNVRPKEYVVPDVLEDSQATVDSFKTWLREYKNIPGLRIGVVQGNTLDELKECYKYMADNADKIAISFNYSWYVRRFPHSNKCTSWMLGRAAFISDLRLAGMINEEKPHHLLGCSNPLEFSFYDKGYDFIDSLDTSSPIVHAIKKVRYPEDMTQWKKESVKLVDLIKIPRDAIDNDLLAYNLTRFRNMAGGIDVKTVGSPVLANG